MIRLTVPSIDDEDLDAVREVLASGFLVQGQHVAEFERAVGEQVGCSHAIAVTNGTCALQLAIAALGIGPGDVCILPAYSWVATANVIELCGARPIFVDIDERTFNIDVEKLLGRLEELMSDAATARRVKAILPVDAFGLMADMPAVQSICDRWNLPVIEDAACALGSSLNGRQAGSWPAVGCFSFHPRKAITTGEGGMVTTNDATLARKLRGLRNHGQDPDATPADFIMAGFNFRLTEFQAALGISQMKKLARIIDRRRAAARTYDRLLEGSALTIPFVPDGYFHVYQSYVTLLPAGAAPARADIIRLAREAGVELQVGTIHMPLTRYYRQRYGHHEGEFPVTDSVASRALTLPLFEDISLEQQIQVVETTLSLLA